MIKKSNYTRFVNIFNVKPSAVAKVQGSFSYPQINGEVWFYQKENE